MDLFAGYEAAWKRGVDEGCLVAYQDRWPELGGFFKANHADGSQPVINLYRANFKAPRRAASRMLRDDTPVSDEQLWQELITYAHEFGHFMSFNGVTPRDEWLKYIALEFRRSEIDDRVRTNLSGADVNTLNAELRRVMLAEYTPDDRQRILAEEQLAWSLGRELLSTLGFTDLAVVDARAQHGLHYYRCRFGTEDLWPCDEHPGYCNIVHGT